MGAESTIYITREDAIEEIKKKLLRISDEKLEDICYALKIAGILHNYSIVSEYYPFNDYANFRQSD